ncbi:MAG: hypothetical protein ACT4PM_12150 [Gemmatimonadales bacterium]
MSGAAGLLLLVPGTPLDRIWEINPRARTDLGSLGWAGIALMAAVSMACGIAARLLWLGRAWGRRLAITLLAANLLGDVAASLVRRDPWPLIGVPIGGALLAYLSSAPVRRYFAPGAPPASGESAQQ